MNNGCLCVCVYVCVCVFSFVSLMCMNLFGVFGGEDFVRDVTQLSGLDGVMGIAR